MNIPTFLTVLRILLIPALAYLFIEGYAIAALTLYIAIALTDFFDGYLARKLKQTSALGAFLDPIADKLLVVALLILFVADDVISGFWVIAPTLIIMREIWVPALRGFIGYDKKIAAVSQLAKWKTTAQMVSAAFLLVYNYDFGVSLPLSIHEIGLYLLAIAALLTIITAYDYTKKAWPILTK